MLVILTLLTYNEIMVYVMPNTESVIYITETLYIQFNSVKIENSITILSVDYMESIEFNIVIVTVCNITINKKYEKG